MHYKGFDILESTGHGKAVAGTKISSSIQIQQPVGSNGYLIRKTISFPAHDIEKREAAIEKAKQLIDAGKIKIIKA